TEARPTETAAAATTVSKPSKDQSEKKGGTVSGPRVGARAPGSMSERDAKSLSNELAALDMQMLVGLNSGASTEAVISQGNLPASLLDQAAMDGRASRRPGQLDMSSQEGSPHHGSHDLADLGNDGRGEGNRGPGTAQSAAPKPRAAIEDQPKREGPEQIPGLEAAIARLQGGFRRCYQAGIDRENPDMAGGVRVTVKIGGNGDVMSASPVVSGNLSAGVVGCMMGKIQGAQFPKTPSGSPAVFVVPITVKKQ
ncbi:MAG: AgmX/PglI C-terminal domain-containing protein, partial [Myxococcales bacterium]|nr:AgmX/PglI C-terminal domain-containing protein [Myxococcales bacterium]